MRILCLDGGGTKTTAIVVDPDGSVIGCGIGGPLAFVWSGGDVVFRSAKQAVASALADGGIDASEIDHALVILGGGNADEARHAVSDAIGGRPARVIGELDAADALGRAEGYDVIVLAGTGTIALGRDASGRLFCGGLGALLGDEGSGFYLGWEAVRAVIRALDGRALATGLERNILVALLREQEAMGAAVAVNAGGGRDLAGRLRFAALRANREKMASLAPIVAEVAAAGDEVACRLLQLAGEELALHALSLLAKMELKKPPKVAGLGGVFRAGRLLTDGFATCLRQDVPEADVIIPELDLIAGAALLALEGSPEACQKVLIGWPRTRQRLRALPTPEGYDGPAIADTFAAIE